MISNAAAFKPLIESYGKQIDVTITHGSSTYTSGDIASCNIETDGSLLTSVMREATIELDNAGDQSFCDSIKGDELNISLTVRGEAEPDTLLYEGANFTIPKNGAALPISEALEAGEHYRITTNGVEYSVLLTSSNVITGIPTGTDGLTYSIYRISETLVMAMSDSETFVVDTIKVEKIGARNEESRDFGTFTVVEAEYSDESSSVKLICYDKMISAMRTYVKFADFTKTVTLGSFLEQLCSQIGLTLTTKAFTNSDVVLDGEKYDDGQYTYRDVLTEIAQAAGGTIAIINDAVSVIYPTETNETISPDNLSAIAISDQYGPINSVVIARTPQEDNLYKQDETAADFHEIKIENNQLMDTHRDDFIDGIYNALHGLTFFPCEISSFGCCLFDIGDRFTLETLDGSVYSTIMLGNNIEITQGIQETIKSVIPEGTKTDYSTASKTDRVINQTVLRVNKQAQTIEAFVSKTEQDINGLAGEIGDITKRVSATMTADAIEFLVQQKVDGKQSIETSTGYTFDEDGLRIKKSGDEMENLLDNSGMYVKRGSEEILKANNEGVEAINLTARQFLVIGTHSRLQDYTDSSNKRRTACFWIGG